MSHLPNTLPQERGIQIPRTSEFSDVLIRCNDGLMFDAHMLVLVSQSTYLNKNRDLFQPRKKSGHYVIEAPSNASAVNCVLDYFYTGVFPYIRLEYDTSFGGAFINVTPEIQYACTATFAGIAVLAKEWDLDPLYEHVMVNVLSRQPDFSMHPDLFFEFVKGVEYGKAMPILINQIMGEVPKAGDEFWKFLTWNNYAICSASRVLQDKLVIMAEVKYSWSPYQVQQFEETLALASGRYNYYEFIRSFG